MHLDVGAAVAPALDGAKDAGARGGGRLVGEDVVDLVAARAALAVEAPDARGPRRALGLDQLALGPGLGLVGAVLVAVLLREPEVNERAMPCVTQCHRSAFRLSSGVFLRLEPEVQG